jgi:hypothetical protein
MSMAASLPRFRAWTNDADALPQGLLVILHSPVCVPQLRSPPCAPQCVQFFYLAEVFLSSTYVMSSSIPVVPPVLISI